jgi:hypothetical protein
MMSREQVLAWLHKIPQGWPVAIGEGCLTLEARDPGEQYEQAEECADSLELGGWPLAGEETQCIQTSCRHCGLDIENLAPFPIDRWMDRGNETECHDGPNAGRAHEPVVP